MTYDRTTFAHELQHAKRVRVKAQAAGRYLDALVRHMNRTRAPWQQSVPMPQEPTFFIQPR